MAEELNESLIKVRLNSVKQAALRIATFCCDAGKISESRRDFPSFGFRLVDLIMLESFYTFISVQVL